MTQASYHQDAELVSLWQSFQSAMDAVETAHDFDQAKARFLGQKSQVKQMLAAIGKLEPKQRSARAAVINALRKDMESSCVTYKENLKDKIIQARIASENHDTTLPVSTLYPGSLHPITLVQRRLHGILRQLGFVLTTGPEIETVFYNFTALNTPKNHPATTTQDTLYFDDEHLLRSHTSPVQIRTLETVEPPLRIFSPGRVFRADTPDATHSPCFYQCEGLVIDQNVTMKDLVETLQFLLERFLGLSLKLRFRSSYFPFTEPSLECDVWFKGRWVEILGCGMVHPEVLKAAKIDSDVYNGFAFGVGMDRLAMLYFDVQTLKPFYDGDCDFIRQFKGIEVS